MAMFQIHKIVHNSRMNTLILTIIMRFLAFFLTNISETLLDIQEMKQRIDPESYEKVASSLMPES